jgi:UDP-GlcNAc:undecaprenyl-phosphate GlcNAc-1-phosphate transferase
MSDYPIFPASVVAFAITIAFMIALRPFAKSVGLVDRPGGRKYHVGDVPIIGGLAMFTGVLAGLAVVGIGEINSLGIVFSFLLLVLIGAIDDKYGVSAMVRVLVQTAAILIITFGSGLTLASIGDPFGTGEILLGPFALLGTLLVGLTVMNSYNLVDGVDGLAGILALIVLIAVAVVGDVNASSTVISVIVAATIFGFLIFNFPVVANRSVRSFMGDAGSILLGFTVFWATLGVSQGENATISPVVGLWFAAMPVFDCLTCFVKRLRAGQSPFRPGRDHFHHTLHRGGFAVREKLAILAGLQVIYATCAILAHTTGVADVYLFGTWCIVGLSQHWMIRAVSLRHRLYIFRMLRAGKLGPYRAARARALQL